MMSHPTPKRAAFGSLSGGGAGKPGVSSLKPPPSLTTKTPGKEISVAAFFSQKPKESSAKKSTQATPPQRSIKDHFTKVPPMKPPPMLASNSPVKATPTKSAYSSSSSGSGSAERSASSGSRTEQQSSTPSSKGVKRPTPGSGDRGGDHRPSSQGKQKQLKLSSSSSSDSSDSKSTPKPAGLFTPKSSSSSSSSGGGGSAERKSSSSEGGSSSSSKKSSSSSSSSSSNKLNSSSSKIDRLGQSHKRPSSSHKSGTVQKKEKHKGGKGMQKFDKYGKLIKPDGLKSMKKLGSGGQKSSSSSSSSTSTSSSSKPSSSGSSSHASSSHKSSGSTPGKSSSSPSPATAAAASSSSSTSTSTSSSSSSSSKPSASSSSSSSKSAKPAIPAMRTGPSAFALYSRDSKKKYAAAHPELDESQVRRALFDNWKSMSDVDKAPYLKKENDIKDQSVKDAAAAKSPSKSDGGSGGGSGGGSSASASASDGASSAPKKSHKKGGGMMAFVTKVKKPIQPRSKEELEEIAKRKKEAAERMRVKMLSKEQLRKEREANRDKGRKVKEADKQREKEERRVEREKERLRQKEERIRKKEEEKTARRVARERNKPRDDDELAEENSKNPLPTPVLVDIGERLGPDQICDVMMLSEFFHTFASALPQLDGELRRIFRGELPTFKQIEKIILKRRSTPDLMQILACMVLVVQENDANEYVKVDEVKEMSIFEIEMAQLPCNEFTATEVLRMYLERMKKDKGREVSFTSELTMTSALPETTDIIEKLSQYDARTLTLKEMLALLKFLCNECLMDNSFVTEMIRNAPDNIKRMKLERHTIDTRQKEITSDRAASNSGSSKSGVDIDADAALAAQLAGEERAAYGRERRATRTMTETPLEKELREKKEADQARDEEEEEIKSQREDLVYDLLNEESRVRGRMLGRDRDRSKYMVLNSASGIFVQQLTGEIGVYQKPEDIDALMANLNERGLREKALKEKLTEEYDDLRDDLTEAAKKVKNRKRSLSSSSGALPTSPGMKDGDEDEDDGEDDGDDDDDDSDGGGGGGGVGDGDGGAPAAVPAPAKGAGVMPSANYSCTGAVYGSIALSAAAAKSSTVPSPSPTPTPSAAMDTAVDELADTVAVAAKAASPAPTPTSTADADTAAASSSSSSIATGVVVKVEGGAPAAVPATARPKPFLEPLPESRQFFETLKDNESPEAVESWMLKANKANILTFNQDVVDGGFGWVYQKDWVSGVKTAKTAQELAVKLVELEAELDLKYMKWPLGRDKRPNRKSAEDGISETAVLGQWRLYAAKVKNTSQLSLLYEMIWLSMRWEKSSKDAKCKVCRKSSDPESMLMCDGCDTGFHMFCLSPRLVAIPEGNWECKGCRPQVLTARKAAQQKISSYVVPGSDDEMLEEEEDSEVDEDEDEDEDEDNYEEEDDEDGEEDEIDVDGGGGSGGGGGANDDDSESDDDGPSLASKRKASTVFASSTRGGQREDDMKKAFEIWKELRDHPDAFWFMEPAMQTADLPDYMDVITTPMDLGTVKRKIDSVAYDDREDFAADVRLVFDNCSQYNHEDTEVAQHGRNVMKLFGKLYKKYYGPKQKAKKSRK